MANSNNELNTVFNNPLPPEFSHWPLDMYLDDDEFRAGYPFSPAPENQSDDCCESDEPSSPLVDEVSEIGILIDDEFNSTTQQDESSPYWSSEAQRNEIDTTTEQYCFDESDHNRELYVTHQNNRSEEKQNKCQQDNFGEQVSGSSAGNHRQSNHNECDDENEAID